jgi:tetratricopeptide (TPR) repeat protein
MAIRYFEQATREADVSIGVLATLGDIYLRERRIDDAAGVAAQAERINRDDSRVFLLQAGLRRARGGVAEAEELLRQLTSQLATTEAVRIRALYELAEILDRSARYDEAMSMLLEVKAMLRPHAGPHVATARLIHSRGREMEQTLSAAVLDRWRADVDKLLPRRRIALLCGHPRSGTTLLEQVLDAHPDIVSAEETKLLHDEAYLPLIRDFPEGTSILEALDAAPPSLLCHARQNYFRCLELLTRQSIGGRLLIDKNPALNMLIPMVVRVFPEAQFLFAVRDPRDVVLSCFMQALPLTPVSCAYLSLESTVRQYASVMGFWLEMRPRLAGRWIEVRYEQMVEDLPGVAHRVLAFLGVDFDEKVLRYHEHARTKRVNSPSHADVLRPIYGTAVGRWRNYQKHLEPYLGPLKPFLRAFGYE